MSRRFGTKSFLHVVFGELAPKSVAIARVEGTALFVAPFMRFFYYLFWPGIVVFNGTANAVVRLFGIPPASETDEFDEEEPHVERLEDGSYRKARRNTSSGTPTPLCSGSCGAGRGERKYAHSESLVRITQSHEDGF